MARGWLRNVPNEQYPLIKDETTVITPHSVNFWTLAAAQISLPAASVQPDAAPVAPVGASAADTAATETVIVADPAVDSLSDPAPNAAEPVVRMTLDECMAYAVEHSPVVRQQDYTNRNYRQDYIESVAALVPSVSGSVSATTSFGRSVDPETNTYTDVSNLSNNYGVSGQMPVSPALRGSIPSVPRR